MAGEIIEQVLRVKDEASEPLARSGEAAEQATSKVERYAETLKTVGTIAGGLGSAAGGILSMASHLPALITLVGNLDRSFRGNATAAKEASTAAVQTTSTWKQLAAAAGLVVAGAVGFQTVKGWLADLHPAARQSQSSMSGLGAAGASAVQALLPIASVTGAVLALRKGLVDVAGGAVKTAADFESLEVRLSVLLGSAGAAKDRMAELFELSKTTPFELKEIVEAEAKLEGFGAAAGQWRGAVMDLAGAMGLPLADAAGAVGRAFAGGAGAADILRERGVLAMVSLRTGVDATELSLGDFREELLATLTDPEGRIAGGTKLLAGTFTGLVSNLNDAWTAFLKQVGDARLFDSSKAGAAELLKLLEENSAAVGELATAAGEGLTAALMLAVQATGGLVDGFDLVHVAALVAGTAFQATVAGILEDVADLVAEVEVLNARMGDPVGLGDDLADAWKSVAAAANEAGRNTDENAASVRQVFDGLGRGHEAAERLVRAMEQGQSQGRLLGQEARVAGQALTEAGEAGEKLAKRTAEASKEAAKHLEALRDRATDLIPGPTLTRSEELRRLLAELTATAMLSTATWVQLAQAMADVERAIPTAAVAELGEALADNAAAVEKGTAELVGNLEATVAAMERWAANNIGLWAGIREGAGLTFQELKARMAEVETLAGKAGLVLGKVGGAVGGAAGSLATGNVQGALAAAGPVGAAVGGIAQIGELGPKGVRQLLTGFLDAIFAGLKALPRILAEVLPDFIVALLTEFLPALVKAIPDILLGLLEGIAKIIRELWETLFQPKAGTAELGAGGGAPTSGVTRAGQAQVTGGGLGKTVSDLGDLLGFQAGGLVDRTGLAVVHAGERVVPAFGAPTSGAQGAARAGMMAGGGGGFGGGPGVTLNLQTAVLTHDLVTELVREIERVYGSYGRATSPLFGGG